MQSHDPRNNFAGVGAARMKTALGEAYGAKIAIVRALARAGPGRKTRKVP